MANTAFVLVFNPISIDNLVGFINELLGVNLNIVSIESRGIHPCEIPQMGGHGANMFVSLGYNLPYSLGHHDLCLSSDNLCLGSNGLLHLEKGCPYIPIHQRRGLTESWSSLVTSSRGWTCFLLEELPHWKSLYQVFEWLFTE